MIKISVLFLVLISTIAPMIAVGETIGGVMLSEPRDGKKLCYAKPLLFGEYSYDVESEKHRVNVKISETSLTISVGGEDILMAKLKNWVYVDSLVWTSDRRLLITLWKKGKIGAGPFCLVDAKLNDDVTAVIRELNYPQGLSVFRIADKVDKLYDAEVRTGVKSYKRFKAYLSIDQLKEVKIITEDHPVISLLSKKDPGPSDSTQ